MKMPNPKEGRPPFLKSVTHILLKLGSYTLPKEE